MLRKPIYLLAPLLVLAFSLPAQPQAISTQPSPPQPANEPGLAPILHYIGNAWDTLTRDMSQCASVADPKLKTSTVVYLPQDFPEPASLQALSKRCQVSIQHLPKVLDRLGEIDPRNLQAQGLLFRSHPYVVPGGRFNEMYGWDSYFIQVGLLRDGDLELAKDMADNFLYEIREYGKILNANRTYYLTRSQPPFLTQMLLGVYAKTKDRKWLAGALPEVEKYYRFWTTEPHLTPDTGLSRYYDLGEGPAPESVSAERDAQGLTHYDRVKAYYRTHEVTDYDVGEYFDKRRDILTSLFYKADRSMRESGFDPSNRFGQFNVDIIHYDPVCLNSLLYMMEKDTGEILRILDRPKDAETWSKRAGDRAGRINRLMWDEKDGLYYDYEFVHKRIRHYPFLTTFFPLWTGIASKEQAAAVEKSLPRFERDGGLQTSTFESGNQWDAPFGWAPLQM